jgi:hypothetical protein
MYPGLDKYYAGEGFPLRFKVEVADDAGFANPKMVADLTKEDFPDVADKITRYPTNGLRARYVRVTATKLRPVKKEFEDPTPTGHPPEDRSTFTLNLSKVGVLSDKEDIAVGRNASADASHGNPEDLKQLTRPARQDGEQIRWNNPQHVTVAASWQPVTYLAFTPGSNVELGDGIFRAAMEKNIQYLLDSYTTDNLLRQFYERAGKIRRYKTTDLSQFWEEDLAGSNAGRFLMGAGNTVRWIKHPELERRISDVVDGIDECKQPNGYIMAYPAETMFYSERAAYTRAWVTHGLMEAGYAGNNKALPLLRGYYDWYNMQKESLPLLLRGAVQGGQGMVANTRVGLSPVGKPADLQVLQRYFEEPEFLKGLAANDPAQIWQYPYDRPHCYLLTNLEAYMDLYRATGHPHYHEAVLGAWSLYRNNWQQAGGSISIIEFQRNPPGSNYIHEDLGELCGSSFWVFLNQRLHLLHPEDERYINEIEKSLYNVALANQDGSYGFRYHTHLEGTKERATRENTCCEGQGTRLLGSLPEHIYSVADDGIFLNLFEPSTITWKQNGRSLMLIQDTQFPFGQTVRCTLHLTESLKSKLRIRVPSWAFQQMAIYVNNEIISSGKPGSYQTLDRVWSNGDTVTFRLPIEFRLSKYTGADQISEANRYALEYGPFLYAVVGATKPELDQTPTGLLENLQTITDRPLQYRLPGHPSLIFMPYWQVHDEEFSCFPVFREQAT